MIPNSFNRPLFLVAGWACVGLGILGIIMPLLPTTPFLLLAVWAFSKSSPELAERIRQHRIAGPYIRDWQDAGVIPVKAKVLALAMMAALLAYMHLAAETPLWLELPVAAVLLAVSAYILSRPGRRP